MKKNQKFAVVLVTAPDLKTARRLARAALKARLAACANLVSKLESHYWWQGKIETCSETMILFKTVVGSVSSLERLIIQQHPYDTAEFVVLPIVRGSRRYLQWLSRQVAPPRRN